MNIVSWNPVLNLVKDLKSKIIDLTGKATYDCVNGVSCVESWAQQYYDLTFDDSFLQQLHPLEINQNKNLVLFRYASYSKILSKRTTESDVHDMEVTDEGFWDIYGGFYRECRSVVIDVVKEQLVITPFAKFMNLNQTPEYSLEQVQKRINEALSLCRDVEVSVKLDGSMQCARYYEGEIVFSGAQSLDPEKSWRLQLGKQFLEDNPNLQRMIKDFKSYTFIFELIHPLDAKVVKYSSEQQGLYLIGVRSAVDGTQWPYRRVLALAKAYGVQQTTTLRQESISEVLNSLDTYKANEAEGVVMFIDGFLVKIKYNDYVQLHNILEAVSSPNVIIKAIADNQYDDLIAKVPDSLRWRVQGLADIIYKYIATQELRCRSCFQRINKEHPTTREFMKAVQTQAPFELRPALICAYKGKPYSWLKTATSSRTPHYRNLSEMGLEADYFALLKKGDTDDNF